MLRACFARAALIDRMRPRSLRSRAQPEELYVHRLLAIAILLCAACGRSQAVNYRTEAVTRGPVSEIVNATGDVSAIVTVNVGSQVSGIIEKLYVDFNSKVKKNQLLATLDPRLFRAQLERADAGLASAKANVEKAQAALADSERIARRQQELVSRGLVSQADLDTALANRDGNAASLSAARAAVLQARADRDLAATNLAFTRIQSPIDGVVVSRSVDVGQTVAAAFQAPTLFLIANDLTKMQILANIDEADVGKVREGLQARFTVDAYPGEAFTGSIREVRQAPTTIQNVVTYAAVIDAPNPEHKLRQGMTASVTITTAHKDEAMRVSNAALRWRPDDTGAEPLPEKQRTGGSPLARNASAASRGKPEGAAQGPGRAGRVYRIEDGRPTAALIRVGLSDGQRTEVIEGLSDSDKVIVGGGEGGAAPSAAQRRRGPF
jgi:HlyD family secretion protein